MKKRLLIGLLTIGMILQSCVIPVSAATPSDQQTNGTVQDPLEQGDETEPEEEDQDKDKENQENPTDPGNENPEDEEEKNDSEKSEEEEENPENSEEEETENPEVEESEDLEEEGTEETEESEEELEESEGLLSKKPAGEEKLKTVEVKGGEGVYQEGAFSVLNDSESAVGRYAAMSEAYAIDLAEAEEYIYQQLLAKSVEIDVSKYKISVSEVGSIYFGVINDHPDLYYANTTFSYRYSGDTVSGILPKYLTGLDDAAFQKGLNDALAVVEPWMSDLEKAVALHDYLVINCEYDYDNYLNGTIPKNSYSAYGVLAERVAVCQGYALAYKLLCNKVGIECYMVTSDSMNHAWNLIVLDGEYYQVDVTWDDPVRDYFGLAHHSNMFVSDATFQARCEHYSWEVTKGSYVVDYVADDTRYDDAFWVSVRSPIVLEQDGCYYMTYPSGLVKRESLVSGSEETIVSGSKIGKWNVIGSASYYADIYSGLFKLGDRLYYNTANRICSVSPTDKQVREETNVLSTSSAIVYGSAYCQGEVKYVLKSKPNAETATIHVADLSSEIIVPVTGISLDQTELTLNKGDSYQLKATVTPSNATTAVSWSCDKPELAQVDSDGRVETSNFGQCVITAKADGKSAECQLTIRPDKPVISPEEKVDKGGQVTIASESGTSVYYTLDGSDPTVSGSKTKKYVEPITLDSDATIKAIAVDNTNPMVVSEITEKQLKVFAASLVIDPVTVTLKEGENATVTIKEVPDGRTSEDVIWESANTKIATVDAEGKISAVSAGTTDITASVKDYMNRTVTAVCKVTVELPVYKVTFLGFRGKVLWEEEVNKGDSATAPDPKTPEGYEFVGWEGSFINVSSDMKIRAQYQAKNYSIIYHLNGGSDNGGNPSTYTIEDSIVLKPAAGKAGYQFTGWYQDEACEGEVFTGIAQGTCKNLELYAGWRDERGLWMKAEGALTDNEIPNQIYTGKNITPAIEVFYGDRPLKVGQDYSISYKNNKAANRLATEAEQKKAPTVIIKGKGNYAGTLTKTFIIEPKSIEDKIAGIEEFQIDAVAAPYNKGKAVNPVPVVKYNGKKLANKREYVVDYPDEKPGPYSEPGEYEILVKGVGNYTGTRTIKFTIADSAEGEILLSKVKISKIPDQIYQEGAKVELNQDMPKLMLGKEQLKLDEDYTLEYGTCIDIGTYEVIITGKGKYKGVRRTSFRIIGESVKNIKVSKLPNLVYTGEELEQMIGSGEQQVLLTDKLDNELTKDVDYTVSYSNNRNVGTAKMIITGKGRYTGSVTKTFKIVPASLSESNNKVTAQFVNNSREQIYLMGGARPKVKVTFNGNVLEEGIDYTLRYKNNTTVISKKVEPTVTITGKKNFKDNRSLTFTIQQKDLSEVSISAVDIEENSKAGKYMSTPVLIDSNGKKLRAGTDYDKVFVYKDENGDELTKTDKPTPGTILTVIVYGKGNYTGEAKTTYRILNKGMNLSKASVKVNRTYIYSGNQITVDKGDMSVKLGKTKLESDDFEIIGYSNNIQKGTAKITIRGKGKYGGTKQATFRILSQNMKWWEKGY